jgi:hypothetical protein
MNIQKNEPHDINIHNIPWVFIAHVEIKFFLFQMALRDTQVMLPQIVHSQVLPFESPVIQSYL